MDGQLLRFRVANHRSLRDEQELSFIADGDGDPRLIHPDGLVTEAVLPVCAIYGANASGKTNVIDALAFMCSTVAYSQRMWEPVGGVPRRPFALGLDVRTPSTFIAEMMIGGARYEYGLTVDDEVVREEWLRAWPNGRKQEWFSRDEQTFEIGRSLHGENKVIEALVRPNSLFLSAAAQNNHEQLTPIFQWFTARVHPTKLQVDGISSAVPQWWGQFAASTASEDLQDSARARARELLAAADLGIEDFQVVKADSPVTAPGVDGADSSLLSRGRRGYRLSFAHRTSAEPRWLDLRDESTGTRALVGLLPTLLPLLAEGGLLAIDELNSLHPMLALALVQLFQDPARNPRGAQLLFNTHESSLLGNLLTDPAPLRRDQVWLTEKDRDGATHLYPLTDYTPRSNENLQRGYLQGRYGAVPFLGVFGAEASIGVPESA